MTQERHPSNSVLTANEALNVLPTFRITPNQLVKYTCVIEDSMGNGEKNWEKGDLHHSRTQGPHQVVKPPASTIFPTPYKIPILISLNQLH